MTHDSPFLIPELSTQEELAPLLRKSAAWFERARWLGTGPAFVKVGRTPMYRREDVLAWLESQRRTSTHAQAA